MNHLTCPNCGASMSLDVCLAHDELRAAMYEVMKLCLPDAALLLRYAGLFRPQKNRMRPARLAAIVMEVLADMRHGSIRHGGREWFVPLEVWRAGLETMIAKADSGKLTLPLTSHGYLFTILADLADKIESQVETAREAERRTGRFHDGRSGIHTGPQHLSTIDPALAKIKAHQGDPMPPDVAARLQQIKKGKNTNDTNND